jgi:penicillin amidase
MRQRTFARKALLAAGGLSAVAGLGTTAIYFWFVSSAREPSGSVTLETLERPVRVLSDTFGIPHLYAEKELDLFRSLGFVHASDRLWQMEFFRRIAQGRLSALFGERALETDRLMRTLNLWGAAGHTLQVLAPAERDRLRAYAEGVNSVIEARGTRLPPELTLLRVRPDPWDETSSLAIGIVMNLDLSHWKNDLSRFWASRNMPLEKLRYLRLGYPEWGPTILDETVIPPAPAAGEPKAEKGTRGAARGSSDGSPPTVAASLDRSASAEAGGHGGWNPLEFLAGYSWRAASNAWAVAGTRTESGFPLLANDMHLGLRAPALWYLAALHADSSDFHVAGLTLPGIPAVVVGHNRDVAWGFTNAMVDDMDFVIEEVGPDGEAYRDGDTWLDFTVRPETIQVRGLPRPEVWRVRETERGPVISDVLPELGETLTAVWIAAHPSSPTTGLWGMNSARSAAEFDQAVRGFPQPHQNVVFASRRGRIGYRLGGRVPLRAGWDGSLPVPAELFTESPGGLWPIEMHPSTLDPAKGFIATANNLQAPGLGDAVSVDYAAPFRALRITQALTVRRDWSVRSTYALQHDTRSLVADRVLAMALGAARRIDSGEALALLEGWDRRVDPESRAAPLFYAWLYRLRALIAGDEYAAAPEWAFFPMTALLAVLEEGDGNPWVNDVRTGSGERLSQLADQALRDALRVTGGSTWGRLHAERHAHPLGSNRWLQRLFGFQLGPYPSGGGPNTVRPDDYRRWDKLDSTSWTPPWTSEYGPSERFIALLNPNGIEGYFLLPTGQSGNPFSRHYRDMNGRWRDGDLIVVPLDRESAARRAVRQFMLAPDKGRRGEGF